MKPGLIPIALEQYVELHLRSNPEVNRADLIRRLESAIAAARRGARCRCGAPIWIIGSAEAGLGCFTCITGETQPDNDYEIDLGAALHSEGQAGAEGATMGAGHPPGRPGSRQVGGAGFKGISRNEPCLRREARNVHSGGANQAAPSPRFRFEAGSYGGPGRGFIPSALCYEQVSMGQWKEYFCLVNPTRHFVHEQEACASSKADLDQAFGAAGAGESGEWIASVLNEKGYVIIEGFQRAREGQ